MAANFVVDNKTVDAVVNAAAVGVGEKALDGIHYESYIYPQFSIYCWF
jgi:hypothetical protein